MNRVQENWSAAGHEQRAGDTARRECGPHHISADFARRRIMRLGIVDRRQVDHDWEQHVVDNIRPPA